MATDYGSPELNQLLSGGTSTIPSARIPTPTDYGSPELNAILGAPKQNPTLASIPKTLQSPTTTTPVDLSGKSLNLAPKNSVIPSVKPSNIDFSGNSIHLEPKNAGGFSQKESVIASHPFTDQAKNIIRDHINLTSNNSLPQGIGGSTDNPPQQTYPKNPYENTAAGIAQNTITGLPKAAIDTAKSIGKSAYDIYANPSDTSLKAEKLIAPLPTGNDVYDALSYPARAVTSTIQKGVIRTAAGIGLEPALVDTGENLAVDQINHEVASGKYSAGSGKFQKDAIDITHKTILQQTGDLLQGAFAVAAPEFGLATGEKLLLKQTLTEAIKGTVARGTQASAAYGFAQALSSGSSDPVELAKIVLTNIAAGAILSSVISGAIKVPPAILDHAKEIAKISGTQRGFVKIPGVPGKAPKQPITEIDKMIASGDVRVKSVNGRDQYQIKQTTGWKPVRDESSAIKQINAKNNPVKKDTATNPLVLETWKGASTSLKYLGKLRNQIVAARTSIDFKKDTLDSMPGKDLAQYVNRKTGVLPEVTGKDTVGSMTGKKDTLGRVKQVKNSEFGKRGDEIAQNAFGYDSGKDSSHAQGAVDQYKQVKSEIGNHKKELAQLEKQAQEEIKKNQDQIRQNEKPPQVSLSSEQKSEYPGNYPQEKTSLQDTTHKVNLEVKGNSTGDRVKSSIQNSESLKTEITNKGSDAYSSGRSISASDLTRIRDEYQAGKKPEDIARGTSNPEKTKEFLTKLKDYYDFQLAADRAAGGDTARVENYMPQTWDLRNPKDLARFNDLAKQKGIKPYDGFRSQPRVFKSYAEGEAAGFKPKNANILEDLKEHYPQASNAIGTQALRNGLIEAAPDKVSMSGYGKTEKGKPFINSNIPGMEGMSFHPEVNKQLGGFEPLKSVDFVNLVKKSGAEAAIERTGLGGAIDKTVAMAQSVPKNAKEAGFTGVVGSIWDHTSDPMKQLLWNFSGFHSLNVSLSFLGASSLHPITGAKGLLQSVGAAASERIYKAVEKSYKDMKVADKEGNTISVYDWGVKSGALEARELPATGKARLNPLAAGKRLIFDREIPVMQMNLAEQAAKKGIVADSPQGIAVGKEIRQITAEINTRTMNINPNSLKTGSRLLLAPSFTISKYRVIYDAFTKFGETNGAAGNLARTAVIGKTAIVGTMATLGTLLATGNFPNLAQVLLNYTVKPSTQTNIQNEKGQKLDIAYPHTFVSEAAGLFTDPVGYAMARLNPLIADMVKLYTNKDHNGKPIVDPNIPESRTTQIVKNIGVDTLPVGMQSLVNQARGKQTGVQSTIQIAGLRTEVSASDPTAVKYSGIDKAKADIAAVTPDDPDRARKISAIISALPADQKKSLQYEELLAGVKTSGLFPPEVKAVFDHNQELLKDDKSDEAMAIYNKLSDEDKKFYKTVKNSEAAKANIKGRRDILPIFEKIRGLRDSGKGDEAMSAYDALTDEQKTYYQKLKKEADKSQTKFNNAADNTPTN